MKTHRMDSLWFKRCGMLVLKVDCRRRDMVAVNMHSGSNGIVQISETGDRVSDYSLFDLNPKNGQFEVGIQLD